MAKQPLHWRLLEDGIEDPILHFAMEETLLRRVAEERSEPTLRLRHTLPSVWIGVYQDPGEDVNLDYCREKGLSLVRRPNPGGTVYQDSGTFCYSAFFPNAPTLGTFGVRETRDLYGILGAWVTDFCATFGVTAEASPVNDVVVGRRKVYGSAQIELGSAIAHSGTFLIHADLDAMEAALQPSRLKFADKGFTRVRDRVMNLADAAGRPISIEEAMDRLVQAFETSLPVLLEPGGLTSEEREEAEALLRSKYATREWTFPSRKPFVTSLATKAPSGVVMLDLGLEGDRIESIDVRGDFLLERQEDLAAFLGDVRCQNEMNAHAILRKSPLPSDLKDALAQLIHEGFDRGSIPKVERP
jgi:lipoate-protein ligase A